MDRSAAKQQHLQLTEQTSPTWALAHFRYPLLYPLLYPALCLVLSVSLASCHGSDADKNSGKNTEKSTAALPTPSATPLAALTPTPPSPVISGTSTPVVDPVVGAPPALPNDNTAATNADSSPLNEPDEPPAEITVEKSKVKELELVITEKESGQKGRTENQLYIILYDEMGEMVSSTAPLSLTFTDDAGKERTKTIDLQPTKFKVQRIPGEEDQTLAALVDTVSGEVGTTLSVDAKFDGRVPGEGEIEFGSSLEVADDETKTE